MVRPVSEHSYHGQLFCRCEKELQEYLYAKAQAEGLSFSVWFRGQLIRLRREGLL